MIKVVGHSYGCYGPLLNGSTTVIYEGKPVGTPDASAFFRVIDEHKAVSSFWSPTALRIIRQNDPDNTLSTKYPMKHLRSLFVAGEHCDRDTLLWAREVFGHRPVIDHYWQTETGAPVTAVCLGLDKHPVRQNQTNSFYNCFSDFRILVHQVVLDVHVLATIFIYFLRMQRLSKKMNVQMTN